MNYNWVQPYYTKPWVNNARGPDAFDCWGLVVDIYKKQLNIQLPLLAGNAEDIQRISGLVENQSHSNDFIQLKKPEEFCIVAMSKGKHIHHVGIWIECDNGLILHTIKDDGFCVDTISSLKLHGYRRIEFYKYRARNY